MGFIILSVKGGEKVTDFDRLYRENYSFILRYLTRLCADSALAEELTQDTFFRAYMNLKKLRDDTKAASWLCSIAKNAYRAWYNEQKRNVPLNDEIPAGAADLSEPLIERELSREVYRRLHELDDPYKEVFMLHVLGELPLKDVSKLFGKSESWARVTFFRAKKQLTERMTKHDEL